MGQAAHISMAASEIEEIAATLGSTVPAHWSGPAAWSFQRTGTNLATALRMYAEGARGAAHLVHVHELEAEAVRQALSAGAAVAV